MHTFDGYLFKPTFQRKTVRWVFPEDRFVTYEPSDESRCRFFGIGCEIEVVETISFPEGDPS